MANLIIKPTSGGSLILQDEGGDAANTIDASGNTQLAGTLGVTGASTLTGNTTVGGTLGVTGTTTVANLTATGTVTGIAGGQHKGTWYDSDSTSVTASVTANTWYDTNLSITTATPNSVTSRYVIHGTLHMIDGNNCGAIRVMRGSTPIGIGDQVGSNRHRVTSVTSWQGFDTNQRAPILNCTIFDDPDSTSALTYKIQYMIEGTDVYINRNAQYTDNTFVYSGIAISTLIVHEINA